jgi:hypothetical protein
MALWSFPYADTINEPLVDAWWIPGFTAQAPGYIYASNPLLANGPGFPPGLDYVTINGSYYDTSGNPLSGYLTFWPSSPLVFNIDGVYTFMPQRYAGLNFSLIGVNQMGDGKIYLQYGRLYVSILATNNANMSPSSFTYHVVENFEGGNQYDILVPTSDDAEIQDIRSLIIPGSIRPNTDEDDCDYNITNISVASTQYIYSDDVYQYIPGTGYTNITQYNVYLAFMPNNNTPSSDDWQQASWAQTTSNNIIQFLIGPNGYVLTAGYYRVWAMIDASPQQAVFPIGFLNIYQDA